MTDLVSTKRERIQRVEELLVQLRRPADIQRLIGEEFGVQASRVEKDIAEVRARWRDEVLGLGMDDRVAAALQLRMDLYRKCMELGQYRTAELQLVGIERLWGLYRLQGDGAQVLVQFNWAALPEAEDDHGPVGEVVATQYRRAMIAAVEDDDALPVEEGDQATEAQREEEEVDLPEEPENRAADGDPET